MSQHVWSAFDRLDNDDLNDSFEFVRPYAALGYRPAATATTAGGEVLLPITTEESDPDAMIANGVITIPQAGLWLVIAETMLNSAPSSAYVGIQRDAQTSNADDRSTVAPAVANAMIRCCMIRFLSAGEVLELIVSSAAISSTVAGTSRLGVSFMRPQGA